jgi:hypothetical protein
MDKAAAEGLEILRETQAAFGLKDRHVEGPFVRRWRRGEIGQPQQHEPEPERSYHLTEWSRQHAQAVLSMLRLAAATKRLGLKKACYRSAGEHIHRLRFYSKYDPKPRDRQEWIRLVRQECSLSVRRAYELIAIWNGDKPLESLRAENTARQKKSRQSNRQNYVTHSAVELHHKKCALASKKYYRRAEKLTVELKNIRSRISTTNKYSECPHKNNPINSSRIFLAAVVLNRVGVAAAERSRGARSTAPRMPSSVPGRPLVKRSHLTRATGPETTAGAPAASAGRR